MAIRAMLADDHDLVRAALRSLLENAGLQIEVVAEASDGLEAVSKAQAASPALVLMDVGMPNLNGIEATRQILADGAGTRVIMLSQHRERRFVLEAFRAGACGYVPKNCAVEELTNAIQAAMGNNAYLSPKIANVLVQDLLDDSPRQTPSVYATLSTREREVLQLLAEGKTTKQIAAVLHLSPKTVDVHRGQIMNKLGIRSVAELTKYAIREGLTTVDA